MLFIFPVHYYGVVDCKKENFEYCGCIVANLRFDLRCSLAFKAYAMAAGSTVSVLQLVRPMAVNGASYIHCTRYRTTQ